MIKFGEMYDAFLKIHGFSQWYARITDDLSASEDHPKVPKVPAITDFLGLKSKSRSKHVVYCSKSIEPALFRRGLPLLPPELFNPERFRAIYDIL